MSLFIGAVNHLLLPLVNLAILGLNGHKGVMGDLLLRLWMGTRSLAYSTGWIMEYSKGTALMVAATAIITTGTCREDACRKV